jgi:hypothetical protein
MVAPIAERPEILRDVADIIRDRSGGHTVSGGLLSVLTGEKATAGRATTGCGIPLCKPKPAGRQAIQIRSIDVSAIAAGIGKTHVVRQDDKEVRLADRRRAKE